MQNADRSVRSVFVGNIPYDATEEKLRDIFNTIGPVLSFRIVYDRETGKPKGYGFCEYKDKETAESAIRNLNKCDFGGRQLRVDRASNEQARDDPSDNNQNSGNNNAPSHSMQQPGPIAEPLVTDPVTMINGVMIGLQPEQLFDLCKQMKTSLLVNPNETRQMLMQNPQLGYALLQALVMVKAIDAQTAMDTLHKQLMQPATLGPSMPMMTPFAPTPMPQQAPLPVMTQPVEGLAPMQNAGQAPMRFGWMQ